MTAALYLRLSRDDGDREESESIGGQRLFLQEYCRKENISVAEIYVDDGYSGTDFDRPAFQKMIDDALTGSFNTIITKDMSRLGRDYIRTGEYIERFFPAHGIRYIAVNDGVDTAENGGIDDMIPFRAVFNDLYAKDISKKVRASLTARRTAGRFIGSSAPYGYQKDSLDRSRLVPDPACAPVVERIYRDYIGGMSMLAIARALTEEHIPTPSQHKKGERGKTGRWNSVIIKRILTNPTYCGHLTQGFVTKINYKTKKRRILPEEQHITVKNTHTPLVSEDLFRAAASVRAQ